MRVTSAFLSSLLLAGVSLVSADDKDVLSLTADNFDEVVKSEPVLLLEFFAPWCGHCKALAPHYEEAATALKDRNIKLAKVDCVDQADLCQEHGIQGYPTLKVVRNGSYSDYGGPRKADGIISYMIKQSLPAVVDITPENFEEVKGTDKLVVVAYVASKTDAPAPLYSEMAEKHRDDYLFGLTTDSSLIEAAKVNTPAIVVYRSYDEPRTDYPYPDPASATIPELEDWISELAIPVFDEVSQDNYHLYAPSGDDKPTKPLGYVFLDPSEENKQKHLDAVRPVAAKYKPKMNFVWIDAIKFGEHAKALNLQEVKWPAFVIQDVDKQLKYPMSQDTELTAESVTEWATKYLDGALKPSLKSAPIPETQEGNVYELVSKTFEEVVFDDSKDVFVEFYASWCGHCKRLKPTWDQLGDEFADRKDRVVIAKMEAQDNDLPASLPFRVSGFPTLKFKPAGSREFIDYEGDRSLDSFISFVEKAASNNLEKPPKVATPDEGAQAPISDESATKGESAEPVVETPAEKHDEL